MGGTCRLANGVQVYDSSCVIGYQAMLVPLYVGLLYWYEYWYGTPRLV